MLVMSERRPFFFGPRVDHWLRLHPTNSSSHSGMHGALATSWACSAITKGHSIPHLALLPQHLYRRIVQCAWSDNRIGKTTFMIERSMGRVVLTLEASSPGSFYLLVLRPASLCPFAGLPSSFSLGGSTCLSEPFPAFFLRLTVNADDDFDCTAALSQISRRPIMSPQT